VTTNEPIEILTTIEFAESILKELQQISPRLQFTIQSARRPEDIPDDLWAKTEILYTDTVLPEPDQVPNLRWLQFHYSGVDFALDAPLLQKPSLQITTLSGAAVPQIAEYVLMMMLALGHRLPDVFIHQARAEWPSDRWDRFMPKELRGSTVGIVGYGSIGREIARLLLPFGVTILAAKRDVKHPQDTGYTIPGLGDPHGDFFHRLYPIQALKSMLKLCDFVIVSVPLTRQTRNMINADVLKAIKSGAYLIDIGRGGVIDQSALLDALQEHRLAGAALDVFAEEPLPPSSPFWHLPNVIISPHIAGISPYYRLRAD
jgi:phosphoglycerate dehydrogenase-like enzyme